LDSNLIFVSATTYQKVTNANRRSGQALLASIPIGIEKGRKIELIPA